jgi:hypothetical protein
MMEENTKMEDQLSEELLDMVTGGTGRADSSGNNVGNGRAADCPTCSSNLQMYDIAKGLHEGNERQLDAAAIVGNTRAVNSHKRQADLFYKMAQEEHQKIIAHGHTDFPPA